MKDERTDRMVDILAEEWDSYIIIGTRVEAGQTIRFHARAGNCFAIQQMLEDELDEMLCGGYDGQELEL